MVQVVSLLRGKDIIDLHDLPLRSKPIYVTSKDFQSYASTDFESAFDVYFEEGDKLCARAVSSQTQSLVEFLVLLTQYNEVK